MSKTLSGVEIGGQLITGVLLIGYFFLKSWLIVVHPILAGMFVDTMILKTHT